MAACTQIWLGNNTGILITAGDTTTGAEVVDMVMGGVAMVGAADMAVTVDTTAAAGEGTAEEGTAAADTMVGAEEVIAPTVTVADTPMAAGVAMEVQEVAVIAAVPLEGTAVAVVADVGDTMVMVAVEEEVAGTIMEVATMARISLGATIAVVDMVVGHRGGEVGVKDTDHESTFRTLRM